MFLKCGVSAIDLEICVITYFVTIVILTIDCIVFLVLKMLCYEVGSSAYYFHEPSHIELTSPYRDFDFGSTLDYQKKTNSLVVGAPRSDLNGKVFTCPLTDINSSTKTNITCIQANINIDKLANDFREPSSGLPDHPCYLGASLAVTNDYIFTCAPLCSKNIKKPDLSLQLGTCGTCFVYNGQNAERYRGLLEMYEQNIPKSEIKFFYGGVGWTTFSDPKNKLILISKFIDYNYITYLDMDNPLQLYLENKVETDGLDIFSSKGLAFTAGIFFNDKKYLYALSMKKQKHTGGIAFMYYEQDTKKLKLLRNKGRNPIIIRDDKSISMYGTVLHSTDLNNDNFSELIVGAPAFFNPDYGYDYGAIYLYKGGGEVVERKEYTHRITATKDGARFGTSIASTDLDGDGFADIFVSAPYGKEGGTVHILLGYEIRQLLVGSLGETSLSSLMHTQTLYINNFETFGYSLHAFERNGENLLAVGSPSNGSVALYRSLPLVSVSMSISVQGDKSVREQDTNFTVLVKVKLENSSKSLDSAFKLFLSTTLTGDKAEIQGNRTNEIELSKTKPESTYNVVVLLGTIGSGDYKITARVHDKEPFNQKDYDPSSVKLTPQSETISVLEVPRHCKGDDCIPQFLTEFEWSGGSEKYILGSSKSETMILFIDNIGNSTYDSCAWIKVTGAQIAVLECDRPNNIWYKCPLKIERNDRQIIYIRLDMSRPTNEDKSLNIEVKLFNHCVSSSLNATVTNNKEITYIFNHKDIEVEGSSCDRNFTDSEIHYDVPDAIINIHESYKIINKGKISWKNVVAVLKYQDLLFVRKYMIENERQCEKNTSKGFVEMKCIIDIDSMSTKHIRTSAVLSKTKLIPHLKKRKLVFSSTLELHFESAESKSTNYTTTLFVQRDMEFWENQNIIIPVAAVVAVFILGTFVFILYKKGFFKRKGKKKVKNLRDSIRKGTFRRPSTAGNASDNKTEVPEVQL